jgi:hypothetical protein
MLALQRQLAALQPRRDLADVPAEPVNRVEVFGSMHGSVLFKTGIRRTLSEVILSQTPSNLADLKRVRLHRAGSGGKTGEILAVNAEKLLKENDRTNDPELLDGDRIEVPKIVL